MNPKCVQSHLDFLRENSNEMLELIWGLWHWQTWKQYIAQKSQSALGMLKGNTCLERIFKYEKERLFSVEFVRVRLTTHWGAEKRCITEGTVVQLSAVFMPSIQLRNCVLWLMSVMCQMAPHGTQFESQLCHSFLLTQAVPSFFIPWLLCTLKNIHLEFNCFTNHKLFSTGKYCACSHRMLYFCEKFLFVFTRPHFL